MSANKKQEFSNVGAHDRAPPLELEKIHIDHKGLNLMKLWFETRDRTLNGHLAVIPLNTDTIVSVGNIRGP